MGFTTDVHCISLLPETSDFSFFNFEKLSRNNDLNLISSLVGNGDVQNLKAKHTVILCDSTVSDEQVYQFVHALARNEASEVSFYDHCLVMVFDKDCKKGKDGKNGKDGKHGKDGKNGQNDKNGQNEQSRQNSSETKNDCTFRSQLYSNYKLFIPVVYVKSEIQAITAIVRHQELSFVNPLAENYKSSTQRFREFLNKVNN